MPVSYGLTKEFLTIGLTQDNVIKHAYNMGMHITMVNNGMNPYLCIKNSIYSFIYLVNIYQVFSMQDTESHVYSVKKITKIQTLG